MIAECRHCGAPLDVKEGVKLTKCRYCGTTNERRAMRTIADVTPKDFRPPPVWTPPAHVPADSTTELRYKPKSRAGCVIVPLLVVGIAAIIAAGRNCQAITGVSPQALATLDLAQTPARMAKTLGGNPSETSAYAKLRSDDFEFVSMSWEDKDLSHPRSFYLKAKDPKNQAARAAVTKKLRRLDPNGSFSWEGVHLSVNDDGSLSASVRAELSGNQPNPRWRQQLAAAWKLMVGAAFGLALAPTDDEMNTLLGTGYPFGWLASIDPATPIEGAATAVTAKFPGAVAETSSGVKVHVPLDHPMFRQIDLDWGNKKGARLENTYMRGTGRFEAGRDALVDCLIKAFGPPRDRDTTAFVKKKNENVMFELGSITVWVYSTSGQIQPRGAIDPPTWTRVIKALDGCRPAI
jgi:hypothetical protein